MRLLECYIENFGKLSQFSYTFSPEMNTFCHENGWGKTTFAAFIKAMLYGLPSTRSKNLFENERSRYQPWQGGRFGGWLTFEVKGKVYRVERSFGAKESQDTYLLLDNATHTPTEDYAGEVLGEALFGIDQKGFERSTYISEKSEYVKPDYSDVQAKLVNVQDFEDVDKALKYLKERRNFYRPNSKRGEIVDLQNEEYRLSDEIREAEAAAKEYRQLQEEISLLKQKQKHDYREIERYRAEQTKMLESRRAADSIRQQKALKEAWEAEEEKVKKAEETPLPSLEEIGEITLAIRALEAPKPTFKPPPAKEEKAALGLPLILGIFGALLLLLTLVSPWLCFVGIGVICVSIWLWINSKNKAKNEAEAPTEPIEVPDENRLILEEFLRRYPMESTPSPSLSEVDEWVKTLSKKRDELIKLRGKASQAFDTYSRYTDEHPLPAERTLPASEEAIHETAALLRSLEMAYKDSVDTIGEKERVAARYATAADRLPELRQKREETKEALATAKQNLEVILETAKYLEEAKQELTASYLDKVQEKFAYYIGEMSQIEPSLASDTYKLTPAFEVTVVENGASHEQLAVSRGTRDLLALCLQFALRDAIFDKENPPLLLDDPFIAFDQRHIHAALGCLQKMAKSKQIIYFSCHESRI